MIGQTLSKYRILAKLGQGGMGVVYLAEDTELRRRVALKVLPAEMAGDADRLERFKREARAVAALNHPSIVTLHSVEEADGVHFLIMEHVEGESLDRLLPADGLPLARFFDIAVPLADALAAAHEKGIVHRDLKPANVMTHRDGRVKVLDFGLAKLEPSTAGVPGASQLRTEALTGEGRILGTYPYMSPEQVEGKPVDHRSDIFSLGVLLYEMATGRRPFQGDTSPSLVSSILKDQPASVSQVRSGLPRHLGRIVEHCLAKDPRDRFQSARDVHNELKALQKELETGAAASAPSARQGRTIRPAFFVAAALAALLVLALLFLLRDRRAARPVSPGEATTIAVLPFANRSPDPDTEYFSDGLTEELIHALASVRGLKVPSSSTVFALKGKAVDAREAGGRLGVDHVLEGSVRKAGDRIRVAAQLTGVADGFQLWSDTWDRRLDDVFAIQDEIAGSIVRALRLTLSPGEEQTLRATRAADAEAYDLYLRGQDYLRRGTREALDSACAAFSRALELDPGYAPAWGGLAYCHTSTFRFFDHDPRILERAEEAGRRAVELAPDLAETHVALGFALTAGKRFEEAEAEFETALRLNPRLAEAYRRYAGAATRQGDLEKAARLLEEGSRLGGQSYSYLNTLPQIYRSLGRTEDEMAAHRRLLEAVESHLALDPDDVNALLIQAGSLAALGEQQRGLEAAAKVLAAGTDDALVLYNTACFFSLAGETDRALDALERSVEQGLSDPDWMRHDSDLDALRDQPRFQALLVQLEARTAD